MRFQACLVLLATAACGSRTPLGLYAERDAGAHDDATAPGAADPYAPACWPPSEGPSHGCRAWRVSGPEQIVATGDGIELGSAVVKLCGAVVAWTASTGSTRTYATRVIGGNGAPMGDVHELSALTVQTHASGSIEIEHRGAAIVSDEAGCRFQCLRDDGTPCVDTTPVSVGKTGCFGLASTPAAYSVLVPSAQFETPVSLVRISGSGEVLTTTPLDVPAGRAVWNRFGTGNDFVLSTFREDPTTSVYTDWLQHFDIRGNALASEVAIAANTAPVLVAATNTGLLAGWSWGDYHLAPLERDAHPNGPQQTIKAGAAIYEMTLAGAGDVMLASMELAPKSGFDLIVRSVAPDGTPRGPATVVAHPKQTGRIVALIEYDHALLLWADGGIRALQLECVP